VISGHGLAYTSDVLVALEQRVGAS
jgi:hypothetical protein